MAITPRNGGFPQPIPQIDVGWGRLFPLAQTIQGFFWNMLNGFLYTQTPTEQFNVFLNVPQNIAQNLSFTTDADNVYAGICNQFTPCLLTESCVPLITESGEYLTP